MAGCWININGEGDTNSHHNHPGAHMSEFSGLNVMKKVDL